MMQRRSLHATSVPSFTVRRPVDEAQASRSNDASAESEDLSLGTVSTSDALSFAADVYIAFVYWSTLTALGPVIFYFRSVSRYLLQHLH